ncbi:XRE family transcriptional regulator [Heyndrickxia coagulans]|uniref:XRE family transcriptional regulator n=1 Tax=Heyndrickxia coagulans TaxID=1398 RepID=UPI001459C683|nr:XRE family transcriptional regulator [Heyndrickxia coagulans]NMH83297.1 XRE family transcriptional regulator [Heyndrickxia coagulans]
MKEKAYVGDAVKTLQEQEELNQEQLAFDLNVSPGMVSHYKNNRRPMHQEVARESLKMYDNPIFQMQVLYEFSDGLTSPVLDGNAIEQHRLAFKEFLANEAKEAFQKLKDVNLLKSPTQADKNDIEQIKQLIWELDDAEIAIANFKMILAKDYHVSLIKEKQSRQVTLKAKGWVK